MDQTESMNVFGAFTFGSLIKTFVPGLVWLIAVWLFWRDLRPLVPGLPALPSFSGDEQTALVMAVPVGLLLGLLSNIVVFMGVNDALVRRPVRARHPDLAVLYDQLSQIIRAEHWATIACADRALESPFLKHADPEMLILPSIGVATLSYVREQYWYHLEFQVNLLFALAVLAVGVLLAPSKIAGIVTDPAATLVRSLIELGSLGALCVLLGYAARKNYHRHLEKMCSLMASSICKDNREWKATGDLQRDSVAPPMPPRKPSLLAALCMKAIG